MAHPTEVIVQHDYTAVDDQELTLRRGDIIKCVEQRPGGWWRGELRGRMGLFPDSFVRIITPQDAIDIIHRKSTPQFCRAVFSYIQANPDELNLAVGDVIQVLGEVEEGWWRGQKGMQFGVFPSNFVVEVIPPLPPKPVREQCRVLFPYSAANTDELTLTEGDILTIISKDVADQGWWRGELRGKIGLFPDNFVAIIPSQNSAEDDPNKKPARPAKNLSTISQIKTSSLTSSKRDHKLGPPENVAAVRKSLEIHDSNLDFKRKISDNTENILDPTNQKLRRSIDNDSSLEKKLRKSIELDNSANKPPVPVKKAGSPVRAMLSELRQKVLSSDRSSQQSTDLADGISGSKQSSEPILKSISPSPSPIPCSGNNILTSEQTMSESFDQVERSSILNDPRSGRVKGPPRRPPSQPTRDEKVILTNGSSNNSSTESPGENEIKPKAREWEKQKAPWMEELKFNQAKKVSPIAELGRSKTISAPESATEKTDISQSKLSNSTDKIIESNDSVLIKDLPTLNPLEMSQSMSSISSKNVKIETSVEVQNPSENPLDLSKSMNSLSSRSTYLESNNKISPNELRTSISSSASVVMRSTTHVPGNIISSNNVGVIPKSLAPDASKSTKANTNSSNELKTTLNSSVPVNGLANTELTTDQMLIMQLNERVANLECLVEAQEAKFSAALEALTNRLAKEIDLRVALENEVQKLERCVTRV